MKYLNKIRPALKEVYSNRIYLVITVIVAFLIFSFNVLVTNYRILISNFSFKLLYSLFWGTLDTIEGVPLFLLITASASAGILLSMGIFLIRRQITGGIGAGSSSILASVVAPACPSCAIGLLSTLGLGGFLAVLPFRGLELGVFGVIVIAASIAYLSGKIVTQTCKIEAKGV